MAMGSESPRSEYRSSASAEPDGFFCAQGRVVAVVRSRRWLRAGRSCYLGSGWGRYPYWCRRGQKVREERALHDCPQYRPRAAYGGHYVQLEGHRPLPLLWSGVIALCSPRLDSRISEGLMRPVASCAISSRFAARKSYSPSSFGKAQVIFSNVCGTRSDSAIAATKKRISSSSGVPA